MPLCLINENFLQPLPSLDIQKVFVRIHGQFSAGGFVAGNDGGVVHLQGGAGPLLADGAFDGRGQGAGLVVAVDQDQDFPGIKYRTDADRERLRRHRLRVIPEEAGVDDPRIRGQVAHAGAGRKARKRLIKRNVAVHADAAHLLILS